MRLRSRPQSCRWHTFPDKAIVSGVGTTNRQGEIDMLGFWNRKPAEEKVDEQTPPVPVEKSESEKAFERLQKLGGGKSATITFGSLKKGAATQIRATKSSMGDALSSIKVNYLLDGKHLYTACIDPTLHPFSNERITAPGISDMRFTEIGNPAKQLNIFTKSVERAHNEWSGVCSREMDLTALGLWHRGLCGDKGSREIEKFDIRYRQDAHVWQQAKSFSLGVQHGSEQIGGVTMSGEYYNKTGGKWLMEATLKQQQEEREQQQRDEAQNRRSREATLNSLPKLAKAGFNVETPSVKPRRSSNRRSETEITAG